MEIISREEAQTLSKKARRQLGRRTQPRHVLYYDSGPDNDYSAAADAIVSALGRFTEAIVIFEYATSLHPDVFADSASLWTDYRCLREAHGNFDYPTLAPGHVLTDDERDILSRLVLFSLQLGWDALLAARPGRQYIWLSHDDRIEIFRCDRARELCRRLSKLPGNYELQR